MDMQINKPNYNITLEEVKERQLKINKLNNDVMQVCDMMQELNNMINEQQEDFDTLETNIDTTTCSVKIAHQDLIKAEAYQSSFYNNIIYLPIVIGSILVISFSVFKK